VLRRADKKSLLHLGFQLRPEIDLKDFAKETLGYGVHAEIKSFSQPGISAPGRLGRNIEQNPNRQFALGPQKVRDGNGCCNCSPGFR
jgi:hypothetical protein